MGKVMVYLGGVGAAVALFASGCGGGPSAVTIPQSAVGAAVIPQPAPIAGVVPAAFEQLSRDVLEVKMEPGGATGTVTYRLHEGLFKEEKAYFIRTDASDKEFAKEHGLVFALLLEEALDVRGPRGERAVGDLYLFKTGLPGQLPLLSTIPGQPDYTPLFQVHWVTWKASPALLTSAEAVQKAQKEGQISVQDTKFVVNYPVVKWPGGEMPSVTKVEPYLGDGQLIGPVDVPGKRVTFKLHRCFPDQRYIVTDTSNEAMAQGMKIAYSPRTALLMKAGPKGTAAALAKVFVFANGPKGDGPMGFQSSFMDPETKDESWSPVWDHFTVRWKDESKATLLTDLEDFKTRMERGEFEVFNGVPDSHPQGFAVNCPVPVITK